MDPKTVVTKPVPNAQKADPREFQLQQVRRRYSATEESASDGTSLSFKLKPSDPDFPFDLPFLECTLHVPVTYPRPGRPSLTVRNKNMGKGYQINIEMGFDSLVADHSKLTLLGSLNALDRNLEGFLSQEKAQTVKLIRNAGDSRGQRSEEGSANVQTQASTTSSNAQQTNNSEPFISPAQRVTALSRREMETRQLESRLGHLPLYAKSIDGIAYTIPIEPLKREELPVPLQRIKSVRLFVPLLYPLLPCRIALHGVSRDAAVRTEHAFERKVRESPERNLMAHINLLATTIHLLATENLQDEDREGASLGLESLDIDDEDVRGGSQAKKDDLDDRSHIIVIPRPPEWDAGRGNDHDPDSSDSEQGPENSVDEDEDDGGHQAAPESSVSTPERGVSLSFPNLEMYGIELLELISLSIVIKCERCKDTLEVKNLRHSDASNQASRIESCKKCATVLGIGELPTFPTRLFAAG